MRINGFHQITAFYSVVFSQQHEFKPQHISLYVFLLNQNNRNNWVEWFKVPMDLGMAGSCIGSKKTYYACLDDLQSWGLINYEKGENMWKAPKVRLVVLKVTATYTSTVPQSEPLPTPLPDLNLHPYINLQPTTLNKKQEAPPVGAETDFMGLKAQVEEWLDYKKSRKEKYRTQGSVQAMIKNLFTLSGGNKETASAIIEQSMANNWAGLFALKTTAATKPQSDHRNNPDASLGVFRYKDRSEFPTDQDYIQNCKTYGHTIDESSLSGI